MTIRQPFLCNEMSSGKLRHSQSCSRATRRLWLCCHEEYVLSCVAKVFPVKKRIAGLRCNTWRHKVVSIQGVKHVAEIRTNLLDANAAGHFSRTVTPNQWFLTCAEIPRSGE